MERLNYCLKMLECGSDHGEESSHMPKVPKHDTGPSVGGVSQHAWRVGDSYGHLAHVGVYCSHGVHLDQGLGHGEDVHELGSGNGYIRDVGVRNSQGSGHERREYGIGDAYDTGCEENNWENSENVEPVGDQQGDDGCCPADWRCDECIVLP